MDTVDNHCPECGEFERECTCDEQDRKDERSTTCPFFAGYEESMTDGMGNTTINRYPALCTRSECQMWGSTYTTENICVQDCRLVGREWVRQI